MITRNKMPLIYRVRKIYPANDHQLPLLRMCCSLSNVAGRYISPASSLRGTAYPSPTPGFTYTRNCWSISSTWVHLHEELLIHRQHLGSLTRGTAYPSPTPGFTYTRNYVSIASTWVHLHKELLIHHQHLGSLTRGTAYPSPARGFTYTRNC